ncbi:amino acid transporter [Penicillium longicatenatum]|uniref:amino acid transporter n=1 Tax=Penicillium longicatenatum TaxID=1561947 RepID=UPI002546809B|nr:amino acid transporter [Penicillium longicatenatum]KAJ5631419.1 amino acid transporter [Penicillium longicatenatum]
MEAKDMRKIHGNGRLSETSLVERPQSMNAIDERKEHFGLWSTLGLSYSIMNTPIAIASALILSVGVGGSPVYIFAYCVAFIFQVIVCLSLAEMAGAFPHPSGETSL